LPEKAEGFTKRSSAALHCKPHRSTYICLAVRSLRTLHLSIRVPFRVFEQPRKYGSSKIPNFSEYWLPMNGSKSKFALVVEGGGMRGIFAAGVLHAFGREGFDPFDLYIGVSAGACHLASHLAGQNDRNLDITLRYSATTDFINPWRFLRGGHLIDLDWLWEQTIRNYRLDLAHLFHKLRSRKKEYIIVATAMESGDALYLEPSEYTLEHYLKVSSSMPILYRNILDISGQEATDGGIADAIPVLRAYRMGATDITVIRSRSSDYVKKQSRLTFFFSLYFKDYPRLVEKFKRRARLYMDAVDFISNPPAGIRITQIAPPRDLNISRTTRDKAILRSVYQIGINYGNEFLE
jgi:predicted patatin/cPLA2 family phospholipase